MRLSDIHIPAAWDKAVAAAIAGGGPVMVLGSTDSGKTTLTRLLLGRFIAARRTVALLDGDVGLATIGFGGVLGLSLIGDIDAIDERTSPDRSWFIGALSAAGSIPQMLLGHLRLIELARMAPVPLVLDTGAFTQGAAAKELHLAIADILRPKAVIGLQSGTEIEHLLCPLERRGIEVHRVQPSPRARPKPNSYRTKIRTERFASQFESATQHQLQLKDYALEGTLLGTGQDLDDEQRAQVERSLDAYVVEAEHAGSGVALVLASEPHDEGAEALATTLGIRGIHAIEAHDTSGLLIGLLAADGECLGLGLLDAWDGSGSLSVTSPIAAEALANVRRLALGTVRLSRAGEEIGRSKRERRLDGEGQGSQPAVKDDTVTSR